MGTWAHATWSSSLADVITRQPKKEGHGWDGVAKIVTTVDELIPLS